MVKMGQSILIPSHPFPPVLLETKSRSIEGAAYVLTVPTTACVRLYISNAAPTAHTIYPKSGTTPVTGERFPIAHPYIPYAGFRSLTWSPHSGRIASGRCERWFCREGLFGPGRYDVARPLPLEKIHTYIHTYIIVRAQGGFSNRRDLVNAGRWFRRTVLARRQRLDIPTVEGKRFV